MKRMKRKTVWAYLDGKKLVDVVKAALDNNMMVDDMKGCILQERIEGLEEACSELETLISELEDEDIEDDDVMEKYNEIVEVINSIC